MKTRQTNRRKVIEALSKPHFITCKHKGIGKIKHCELECYTMQGPHKELTTTNIEAAFRVMTNCDDNTLYLPNSTFWFDRLHKEGFAAVKTWKATKILTGYVRALWRKEGGKPEGRVLIPIHRPGHWVLACINLTAQRLEHYDSRYRDGSAAKAAGEQLQGVGEKILFLRCSWEPNVLLLSAVSSALDLPTGPFGWLHILVSSDLKLWRPK